MTKDHHNRKRNTDGIHDDPQNLQKEQPLDAALVSVVIPCYNQAHFLGEAIESVLAQSYPNFEVVVVDDGSMDNTSEVASRYPEVRYVRQDNQGLSAARNKGVSQSKGSYLVFLDADDRLLPQALEVGVRCLEAHPECAFASGKYRNIAADGSSLSTPEQPYIEKDHYMEILRCRYFTAVVTLIHRRAMFEAAGGFDTSWSHCEDTDLALRITRMFPVYYHGEVVAEVRLHGSSWSHNSAPMLRASVNVLRSQSKHVRGDKRLEEALRKGVRVHQDYYGGQLAYEARVHLRKREWKQAMRDMLMLLRYYPRVVVRAWQKLRSLVYSRQ